MIVSHQYRYIFLKTRKTAGTSIELALSRCCGDRDTITPVSWRDELLRREVGGRPPQHYRAPYREYAVADWWRLIRRRRPKLGFYNHMSAAEIRARIAPGVWRDYFKFCFERDPWDKVVSYYHYRFRRHPGRAPSFSEFVLGGGAAEASDFDAYAPDGTIAMDYVGRYETLVDSLDDVRQRVGLPEPLTLPQAKAGLRRDRRPLAEVYGPRERDAVAAAFAREIAAFDYRFGGAAGPD